MKPFHVLIATCGEPDFLRHQVSLLRRHSREPLEIVVVNDTKDRADPLNGWNGNAHNELRIACRDLAVEVIRFPQAYHSRRLRPPRISAPSSRAAEAIQLGFDDLVTRSECENLAIIDSDMFPFRPFSFTELLNGNAMAIVPQWRSHRWLKRWSVFYPWPGFFLMNIESLPTPGTMRFDARRVKGIRTDTAGRVAQYLSDHPDLAVKTLQHLASGTWSISHPDATMLPLSLFDFVRSDPANSEASIFSEIYEQSFLHLRAGSNWMGNHSPDRNRSFIAALRNETGLSDGAHAA